LPWLPCLKEPTVAVARLVLLSELLNWQKPPCFFPDLFVTLPEVY